MVTIKTTIEIANERDEFVLSRLSEPNIVKEAKQRDNLRWALVEEQKEVFDKILNEFEELLNEGLSCEETLENMLNQLKDNRNVLFGDE